MSDDIFDKLDSLMNKHRAEGVAIKAEAPEPVAEPEIPILIDEVPDEALSTMPIPVLTEVVEEGEALLELELEPIELSVAVAAEEPPVLAQEAPEVPAPQTVDSFTDLEQRVTEAVENYVTPRLASKLDLALGELLEQFRGEIEHMVRDAVTRELQQYLDTLGDDQHSPH